MKQAFIITGIFLLLGIAVHAQSEKTLVRSLPQSISINTTLKASGDIDIQEWDKDYIRLLLTVKSNTSTELLSRLITVGRYEVSTHEEDGIYHICFPKMAKPVMVKGIVIEEVLSFQLFVPYGTTIKQENPHYASRL